MQKVSWEQRELENIVNRFDNLRVPVAESLRKKGNIPYYGANGIQGYVDGYTHNGEFILIAEDGANDLNNYPVRYVNGKIWVNNHAHVIQSKQEKSNNLFISFALSSADIKSLIVGGSRSKLTASSLMQIITYANNINCSFNKGTTKNRNIFKYYRVTSHPSSA